MSTLNGKCLCGDIKYTIELEEKDHKIPETAICSCEDCQIEGGGAHSLLITVTRKNLKFEDPNNQLKEWKGLGTSGKAVYRKFCSNCGTSFGQWADVAPSICWMKAGTLDREIKMKLASPTLEVYGKNALPFTTETVNGPRFKMLPGSKEEMM